MGRLRLRPLRLGLHLEGDLQWRSRYNRCQRSSEQACRSILQDHALHRHCGLVHLPSWLFLRILDGKCCGQALNLIYNLADFVNKIAFCLAIWAAAKNDTLERVGKGETHGGSVTPRRGG